MSAVAIDHHISAAFDAARPGNPLAAAKTTSQIAARENAQDFEVTFLNTMFQQMFTATEGEGPMGAGAGAGVWRSFLTDEFAKSFSRNGGIGLAEPVYRSLLAHQEAASAAASQV